MSKEYDETKVKPVPSMSQELEEISGSRVQNILSQKKYKTNFDDTKYAVKTRVQFPEAGQQPSKLRGFLKSIPVIRKFLAKIFLPEKEAYEKPRLQTYHSSEAKNETCVGNKHTGKVGSRLKKSNVEQVDKEEKDFGP